MSVAVFAFDGRAAARALCRAAHACLHRLRNRRGRAVLRDAGDRTNIDAERIRAVGGACLALRVAELDAELAALQTHTRRYYAGWLVANSVFAAAQVAIALSAHSDVVRTNYLVGAGLSAAGGVMLLAQPWPGFSAHDRYRALPDGDPQKDVAKIDYGEALRARQRHADRSAITPLKHGFAAIVALGSGVRAGMSFNSPYQGVFRALFVLTVLELQILTRPRNVLAARSDLDKNPRWLWSAGPWVDRRCYGAQLNARF